MGFLIRRDNAIPVQARRADGGGVPPPVVGPTVVLVPTMGQVLPQTVAPNPPAAGTQNVIYVVNTPPPPAAAAAPPPQAVHHHHHHTTQVVMPRRRRLSKGTSFLGTLGFVVGGLACGVDFLPQVARFAGPIALVGLTMAALAWAGAVLLRRVHTGMPLLGMVVSAAGYGLWLFNTGQAQSTYDRLRTQSPVPLPAVKIPAPTTPAAPALIPPAAKPAAPPKKHEPTIFDTDQPGWQKPAGGH